MYQANVILPERKIILNVTPKHYNSILLKDELKNQGMFIKDRFKQGDIIKLSNKLNINEVDIYQIITRLRKQQGIKINSKKSRFKEIEIGSRTPINYLVLADKQYRAGPRLERTACDTFIHALTNVVPYGGISLIIGTPAIFSACPEGNYISLCMDNLEVAIIAKLTTQVPGLIVIGNCINHKKAMSKATEWKSNNITNKFKVLVGPVVRDTLYYHIKLLAKKYKLVKVILMTSGVWEDTISTRNKRKKDFPHLPPLDFNFEAACKQAVKDYDNVHILAMAKGYNPPHQMTIKYLHRETYKDIEMPQKVKMEDVLK